MRQKIRIDKEEKMTKKKFNKLIHKIEKEHKHKFKCKPKLKLIDVDCKDNWDNISDKNSPPFAFTTITFINGKPKKSKVHLMRYIAEKDPVLATDMIEHELTEDYYGERGVPQTEAHRHALAHERKILKKKRTNLGWRLRRVFKREKITYDSRDKDKWKKLYKK